MARSIRVGLSQNRRYVTSTQVKNSFGKVLDAAMHSPVFITKSDAPKAVLLSIDEYERLAGSTDRKLESLRQEFDTMLERMQRPAARRAMKKAFHTKPSELGKIAVEAARKRG
jgi:antitoxin Phd